MRRKATLSGRREIWRYEWDPEDRLRAVVTPDGQRWLYRYDPLGRRIAKQRLAPDGVTVAEQVDFAWDGTALAEQTAANPAVANVRSVSWHYDGEGAQPIAQSERIEWRDAPQAWVDQRFYGIITDLVGTPTELVDADGALAWHATSTLWGRTAYRSVSTDVPLRFPGQYFDPETGLHYNYHRYYDPDTGRYTSTDPLGLAPSPNPSTYVHNPHTWTDPLGLTCTPGGDFKPPDITVDRHGRLTNGTYTLDSAGMSPHVDYTPGKSQFGYYVNSGKAVLDGASYADNYGLWEGNKAKVPVENGHVGYTSDGTPTNWVNIYRNRNGFVHGSPGNPPR
jgi:RHS repeat-associated protein